jgi:hypothetical protein
MLKIHKRTPDCLILRSYNPIVGVITLLIGVALCFFAFLDITENRGESGGYYGVPIGMLVVLFGLAQLTQPVDYVLNRKDKTYLHTRGFRPKTLVRAELTGLRHAYIRVGRTINSNGAPNLSYGVRLAVEGDDPSLSVFGRKKSAEKTARLVNDWLGVEGPIHVQG